MTKISLISGGGYDKGFYGIIENLIKVPETNQCLDVFRDNKH